jgi:hypothetical protein
MGACSREIQDICRCIFHDFHRMSIEVHTGWSRDPCEIGDG